LRDQAALFIRKSMSIAFVAHEITWSVFFCPFIKNKSGEREEQGASWPYGFEKTCEKSWGPASSVGVKPQAEAPHSAPVAPRGGGQPFECRCVPSSSVARARQGARRKGRAGRWQMERWLEAAPSSDAPGTGRSGAEARIARTQKKGRTHALGLQG